MSVHNPLRAPFSIPARRPAAELTDRQTSRGVHAKRVRRSRSERLRLAAKANGVVIATNADRADRHPIAERDHEFTSWWLDGVGTYSLQRGQARR